jgi:hypothetical protein
VRNIDPEKLQDMVRSILPSRARTGPRCAKAIRKRAHRRVIRMELHHEDAETTAANFLRGVSVSDIVGWRRGADKLNHFMRWCRALTKGMTTEDALAFVRSMLPKNVIGDHAYGHWESERKPRFRYLNFAKDRRRRDQSYQDSGTFRLRRALDEDPALHGRLNAEIKNAVPIDEPRRLLEGVHDVDAFVRDVGEDRYLAVRKVFLRMISGAVGFSPPRHWGRPPEGPAG